jgi:hypothetical protein
VTSGPNEINNTCTKIMHMEVMNRGFTVLCQYLKKQTCLPTTTGLFRLVLRIHWCQGHIFLSTTINKKV